jgi:hypothetical protein
MKKSFPASSPKARYTVAAASAARGTREVVDLSPSSMLMTSTLDRC